MPNATEQTPAVVSANMRYNLNDEVTRNKLIAWIDAFIKAHLSTTADRGSRANNDAAAAAVAATPDSGFSIASLKVIRDIIESYPTASPVHQAEANILAAKLFEGHVG